MFDFIIVVVILSMCVLAVFVYDEKEHTITEYEIIKNKSGVWYHELGTNVYYLVEKF